MNETAGPTAGKGPLAGVVVIDVATTLAAPAVAAYLGDYGATVIKVELPGRGDAARLIDNSGGDWWSWVNRDKKLVTCRLSDPRGADLLKRLISRADVLIENFRPGRMEAWGLGYDVLSAINPGLIMLRVTGFGQSGPYSPRRAYGALAEAMSGTAHLTGEADQPPLLSDFALGDSTAGITGWALVSMALLGRDRDPEHKGTSIDMPLYMPLLSLQGRSVLKTQRTGESPARTGGAMGKSPRAVRRTKDGQWMAYSIFAALGSGTSLVDMLDIKGDPRFATPEAIGDHGLELSEVFATWLSKHTRAEAEAACENAQIPLVPVYDFHDVLADPHIAARGDLVPALRDGEEVLVPGTIGAMRASTDIRILPGAMGSDNEEIYGDFLGASKEDVAAWKSEGII